MGNTPSPEKEEVGTVAQEIPSSPMQAIRVAAGHGIEGQAMLVTTPMDVTVSTPKDDSSLATRKASHADVNENMTSELAEVSNADTGITGKESTSPFHENSILEHGKQLLFPRRQDERILHPEPVPVETASNAVQALSRDSSPPIVSSTSQSSAADSNNSEEEGQAIDSASEVVWSGSASDFGLDGAVMSRLRPTAQVTPMASEIGRRWIEMQEAAGNLQRAKTTIQASGAAKSATLQKGTQIKDGVAPQFESDQPRNEAPRRTSIITSTSDEHLKPLEQNRDEPLDMEDDGEDVPTEDVEKGESDKSDAIQSMEPDSLKKTTTEQGVQVDSGANLDNGSDINDPGQAGNIAREETLYDERSNERTTLLPATLQDSVAALKPSMEQSPSSRIEVIDLESGNAKDVQKYPPASTGDAPRSLGPGITKDQGAKLLNHADELTKRDAVVLEEHRTRTDKSSTGFEPREIKADNDELDGAKAALGSLEEHLPIRQEEKHAIFQEESPVDPTPITDDLPPLHISKEPIATSKMGEDISYPQLPSQDLTVDVGNFLPHPGFTSTVQDTSEDAFTSQVLAPGDSQKVDLMHKLSTLSTLSAPADEIPPTPNLTQGASAGIVDPETEDLEQTDHQSIQEHASEGVEMDMQVELHNSTAQKKLVEVDEVLLQATAAEAELKEIIPLQLRSETRAPRAVNRESSVGKGSSLIARLREVRRLSNQKSGRRLSGNPASPWFIPRRSSQVIPDNEAKSDTHATSPVDAMEIIIKTPTRTTPENPEKRLSQSFIRSSPLQSPPPKSPTSSHQGSQYLPSSQVATGFRTNLSYFIPLTSLHTHYGTTVDIIAVAISSTSISRARSGPKDYTQTLYLTDPSSTTGRTPTPLTTAQIFRPWKPCFPTITVGDAVLLRDFKVQSFQKALSLMSTDVSAWAIFRKDEDVQIRGPPVEYGPEERAFARAHWNWWASLDAGLRDRLIAAVPKAKTGSAKRGLGFELPTKSSNSTEDMLPVSLTERSLGSRGSLEPAEAKEEGKAATQGRRVLRPRNAQGQASASPEKDSIPRVEEIHELRDGTRYVDRKGVGVGEVDRQRGVHELRDGTRYRDHIKK